MLSEASGYSLEGGALSCDCRDPLQLENGRSEFFRKPMVLGFEGLAIWNHPR
jgi:hypothetical protein